MISDPQRSRGFTLLEIMLVVMVIAIAAAAFMPVALDGLEQSRTRGALRDIIAINRYARSRAILDRKPVAVVYSNGEDQLQLLSLPARRDPETDMMFNGAETDPVTPPAENVEIIRSRSLPKFVRVTDVTGAERDEDGFFVIYGENGSTFSHQVKVSDPGGSIWRIGINGLTGEIRLED